MNPFPNPDTVLGRTGWFAAQGHIITNAEDWEIQYTWYGHLFNTRNEAIARGFKDFGADDFNVGHLTNDVLDWWGWMDREHPAEDRVPVAKNLGFKAVTDS